MKIILASPGRMRALREGVYRSLGLGFVMEEVYEGLRVVNLERRGFFLVCFVFFFKSLWVWMLQNHWASCVDSCSSIKVLNGFLRAPSVGVMENKGILL